jgi:basic membrane lipoprotein Med (substrate-binding protein (PBP1-ABC) superfamily)
LELERAAASTAVVAAVVVVIIVLGGVAYLVAGGALSTTTTVTAAPTTSAAPSTKVAMLLPGVISDGSWNLGGYQAIETIGNTFHYPIAYSESVTPASCPTVGTDYVNAGYKVIILDDISMGNCAFSLGKQFPNTYFIWVGALNYSSNVVTVDEKAWESAYLSGIVAAGASKTGTIGFVSAISFFTVIAH